MAIDVNSLGRWLESLHVVRDPRLEREEPHQDFTTVFFTDGEGNIHVVHVNQDGSPREYKDPRGRIFKYKIKAVTGARETPTRAMPLGEPEARPEEARWETFPAGRVQNAQETATPPAAPAGKKVLKMHRGPRERDAEAEAPKKSMEDIVLEWAREEKGLAGLTIIHREIRSDGIVFKMKGPDGSEYEASTGKGQKVTEFRRV